MLLFLFSGRGTGEISQLVEDGFEMFVVVFVVVVFTSVSENPVVGDEIHGPQDTDVVVVVAHEQVVRESEGHESVHEEIRQQQRRLRLLLLLLISLDDSVSLTETAKHGQQVDAIPFVVVVVVVPVDSRDQTPVHELRRQVSAATSLRKRQQQLAQTETEPTVTSQRTHFRIQTQQQQLLTHPIQRR